MCLNHPGCAFFGIKHIVLSTHFAGWRKSGENLPWTHLSRNGIRVKSTISECNVLFCASWFDVNSDCRNLNCWLWLRPTGPTIPPSWEHRAERRTDLQQIFPRSIGFSQHSTGWRKSAWLFRDSTLHCLQSLKSVAPSTAWRHFESLRKSSESMFPESLWEFLQDSVSGDPLSFLWLLQMRRSHSGWYLVNRRDGSSLQSFSRHFLGDLCSVMGDWIVHMHHRSRRYFVAGIFGPDFVQSRK